MYVNALVFKTPFDMYDLITAVYYLLDRIWVRRPAKLTQAEDVTDPSRCFKDASDFVQ